MSARAWFESTSVGGEGQSLKTWREALPVDLGGKLTLTCKLQLPRTIDISFYFLK